MHSKVIQPVPLLLVVLSSRSFYVAVNALKKPSHHQHDVNGPLGHNGVRLFHPREYSNIFSVHGGSSRVSKTKPRLHGATVFSKDELTKGSRTPKRVPDVIVNVLSPVTQQGSTRSIQAVDDSNIDVDTQYRQALVKTALTICAACKYSCLLFTNVTCHPVF